MNIGDRVKIVATPFIGIDLQPGRVGVIVDAMPEYGQYHITMEVVEHEVFKSFKWTFNESELEMVE